MFTFTVLIEAICIRILISLYEPIPLEFMDQDTKMLNVMLSYTLQD